MLAEVCNVSIVDEYVPLSMSNKESNCSGPQAFKSQRVGYQSNQKLLHHYQSAFGESAQFIHSFFKYSRF